MKTILKSMLFLLLAMTSAQSIVACDHPLWCVCEKNFKKIKEKKMTQLLNAVEKDHTSLEKAEKFFHAAIEQLTENQTPFVISSNDTNRVAEALFKVTDKHPSLLTRLLNLLPNLKMRNDNKFKEEVTMCWTIFLKKFRLLKTKVFQEKITPAVKRNRNIQTKGRNLMENLGLVNSSFYKKDTEDAKAALAGLALLFFGISFML